MNTHLRTLAERASREIDLTYPGDAFPSALAKLIIRDLNSEFAKVKWMGDDEGWERAIKAVTKEISDRYGVK
jgi:hypothetical protein